MATHTSGGVPRMLEAENQARKAELSEQTPGHEGRVAATAKRELLTTPNSITIK